VLYLEDKAVQAIDNLEFSRAAEVCKKAEDFVEALQAQGSLIDPDVTQVILHNSALCSQQ
jgi:hypothetical protein